MKHIQQHIAFRIFTILIVATLLLPSTVKTAHIFSNHKHDICLGESEAHFHHLDVDCSFYKYKINPPFTLPNFSYEIIGVEENHFEIISKYQFVSDYQKLPFLLRGPPLNG